MQLTTSEFSRFIVVKNELHACSFADWCREYEKEYKSKNEEENAYKNYLNNVDRVEALNKLYKER